jgi:hypothetical protein
VHVGLPIKARPLVADGEGDIIRLRMIIEDGKFSGMLWQREAARNFVMPLPVVKQPRFFIVANAEIAVLHRVDHKLAQPVRKRRCARAVCGNKIHDGADFLELRKTEMNALHPPYGG